MLDVEKAMVLLQEEKYQRGEQESPGDSLATIQTSIGGKQLSSVMKSCEGQEGSTCLESAHSL